MDALGSEFKIPYFEILCEHLTMEQSKLIQLDSLSGSKNQDLVAHTSKGKQKTHHKKKKDYAQVGESTSKTQHKSKHFPSSSKSDESSSKTRKKNSSETYSLCGIHGHVKSKCWLKLESLNESMRHQNISVPKPSSSGKGNALSVEALYAYSNS